MLATSLLYNFPDELKPIINIKNSVETRAEQGLCFCIWKKYEDSEWNIGNINFSKMPSNYADESNDDSDLTDDYFDGSKVLLASLNEDFDILCELIDIQLINSELDEDVKPLIEHIFDFKPISYSLIRQLSPNKAEEGIKYILLRTKDIGYPVED